MLVIYVITVGTLMESLLLILWYYACCKLYYFCHFASIDVYEVLVAW